MDVTTYVSDIGEDGHQIECIATLIGHSGTVGCLTLFHGLIVSGSYDKTIKIWDPKTGALIKTLIGHSSGVCSLVSINDMIVSGSYGGCIRIWDPTKEYVKTTLCERDEFDGVCEHSSLVSCLTTFNGCIVSSGSTQVKIFPASHAEIEHFCSDSGCVRILEHPDYVQSVATRSDQIISGTTEKLRIWNPVSCTCIRTIDFSGPSKGDQIFFFSDFQDGFFTTSSQTIKMWDLEQGKAIKSVSIGHEWIQCLALYHGHLIGGTNEWIKIWNLETGLNIDSVQSHLSDHGICSLLVYEGQLLSSGGDQAIKIWDMKDQ